ncbi:MAG: peptide chain release factor 2 [Alphaproteobacteria bacterium]|nr:peptide chain release factor 2 [Alphaproteobacteria bacterium]
MRAEIQAQVEDIKQSLELLRRGLDWDAAHKRLAELNAKAEDPKLWDKPQVAQKLMRERTRLTESIAAFGALEARLADSTGLVELAEAENEPEVLADAERQIGELRAEARSKALAALLSGEADGNDAYLEIHAGAGGTESQDWAEMLARMYTRWAERRGFKAAWIEESPGEEAGLKSATIEIKGEDAYGWLKTESGVHRLVRISPFDSNARRQTSFASVWVYPVVDEDIEIEVLEKDLRVDTYRASGAGGQHVNKTDSAVRITHLPTNIVVASQSERSQHKNRATAMRMLKARLFEREMQKRDAARAAEEAAKTDIGWGHQIRSYVLHPYQMVKDLRTAVETSDTQGVLDGDLDAFMEAALAERLGKGAKRADAKADAAGEAAEA